MNKIVSPQTIEIYAKRLHNRRIDKGYTLQALASCINTTKQNLSDIENRKIKSINTEILTQLAKHLDCSKDYLIGESDITYKSAPIDGKAGTELIIPAEFTYPGARLKNRLFELNGENIVLLNKIVTFLEKSDKPHREIFNRFLDSCLDLISYKDESKHSS